MPKDRRQPLLSLGVYECPKDKPIFENSEVWFGTSTPQWSASDYQNAFVQVHKYISAGDIYQANLTFPMHAEIHGTSEAISSTLKQAKQKITAPLVYENTNWI